MPMRIWGGQETTAQTTRGGQPACPQQPTSCVGQVGAVI